MREARTRMLLVGAALIALSTGLGLWTLLRGPHPFVIDEAWNSLLVGLSSHALEGFGRVMGVIGGVWVGIVVVTLGAALALVLARKAWWAVYLLGAQVASMVVVQVLKQVVGRARPEEIMVLSDEGSFPSGHTAAAATVVVVAIVLWRRWWVVAIGAAYVLLMGFSRTAVHAHWLTDVLGGAMVGAGVALVVAALLLPRVHPGVSAADSAMQGGVARGSAP